MATPPMTTAAHFFPDTWMEQTSMGELYLSPERFSESKEARKSAHFMRRAWEKLGLEAILAYEGQPTIYFKSVPNFDPAFEAELHCLLWNQGTANLLLIRDRTKSVRVYSAFSPPSIQPIGSVESGDARLVETLCHIASALDLTEFLQRVETGRLYQSQRDLFSQETAVDETLLRNLRATAEQLCDVGGNAKLHRSEAHALLGRLLFTCYLRARGVLSDDYLKIAAGIELTGDRSDSPASINDILASYSSTDALDILFKIFTALKRDFNGSLFGNELEGERKAVRAAHMDVLRGFLNGDDLQTGQRALGFPAYDFSLIPVETISAIYEEFLKDEDPEDQDRKGAFYTPRHLAELAIDVATDSWDTLLDKKCLDPACGSGIFLVILFNRMAEEWRFRNPNAVNLRRAKALRLIMSENIWGIDLNPTACRIACFSLYLAFFDQLEPTDIWRLKRSLERENIKVLPPLLATIQKNFSETTEPRIFSVNFFQNAIPIPSDFDLIVGNPPWIGRNQTTDAIAEDWLFSPDNTYLRSIVRTKKQSRACIMPEKQLAHAFMWKAPSHLKSQGRACLILPTKVWMNEKTNEFQNMWFKHFKIEHIIQLSDLRHLIFVNAKCPATIVRYSPTPSQSTDVIAYDVPKASRVDPRQGRVTILSEDQKIILLSDLIEASEAGEVSAVWKMPLWGSGRDIAFLSRLRKMPRLGDIAGEPNEGKRWRRGEGFKPYRGKPPAHPRWWSDDHLFINAKCKELKLICSLADASMIGPEPSTLHRNPNRDIFKAPMVLVSDGFGKIAFCGFDAVFTDSLYSISGERKDEDLLRFLAAVLSSKLAKYYLFHTAANWGSERDKVHRSELLRMPFPLPEDRRTPASANDLISRVANRVANAEEVIRREPLNLAAREQEIISAQNDIWPLIAQYYEISNAEQILIDDAIHVDIPSSTPTSIYNANIITLRDSSKREREAYANQLCKTINTWADNSAQMITAHTHVSISAGLALLTLEKHTTNKAYSENTASSEISDAIRKINTAISINRVKSAYTRSFTLFDGDKAYILKSLTLRHWTRAAALNDADAMLAAFLSSSK